jgi:DNA polymerase (family 10)
VKVVISTDSHNTGNLKLIWYGVKMARRGWLEKRDVINTMAVGEFLGELRGKRRAAKG